MRCGLPFENEAPLHGVGLCGLCRRDATEFDWGRGYGAYEGTLRHLIHLLKYAGMEPLARPLGERLATLVEAAGPIDRIVPVPLDRRRRSRRGFNQAELLAREVGRITGLPVETGALRRIRATGTQTGLTRRQRRLNVQGVFQAPRPERIAGQRLLLIDDVITTGATAGACARALKRAGAARVAVLALARARRRIVGVPAALARPQVQEASCEA